MFFGVVYQNMEKEGKVVCNYEEIVLVWVFGGRYSLGLDYQLFHNIVG